jgi:hypothetical protein
MQPQSNSDMHRDDMSDTGMHHHWLQSLKWPTRDVGLHAINIGVSTWQQQRHQGSNSTVQPQSKSGFWFAYYVVLQPSDAA